MEGFSHYNPVLKKIFWTLLVAVTYYYIIIDFNLIGHFVYVHTYYWPSDVIQSTKVYQITCDK